MRVMIYGLLDPDTGECRYVGKTVALRWNRRYNYHIWSAYHFDYHKCRWIRSLLEQDKRPLLALLDIANEDNWEQIERDTIARYRAEGHRLTNATPGGESPPPWTDERRRVHKLRQVGKYVSPETREKLRKASMGNKSNLGKGGWKHSAATIQLYKETASSRWTPAMKEAARQRMIIRRKAEEAARRK